MSQLESFASTHVSLDTFVCVVLTLNIACFICGCCFRRSLLASARQQNMIALSNRPGFDVYLSHEERDQEDAEELTGDTTSEEYSEGFNAESIAKVSGALLEEDTSRLRAQSALSVVSRHPSILAALQNALSDQQKLS